MEALASEANLAFTVTMTVTNATHYPGPYTRFSEGGGGKAPKFQNFPKIIRLPLM